MNFSEGEDRLYKIRSSFNRCVMIKLVAGLKLIEFVNKPVLCY